MTHPSRENPLYHVVALCKAAAVFGDKNPRVVQWAVTGLLSFLIGGGAAVGLSRSGPLRGGSSGAMDRQWLADSFPIFLRPTIRKVVQEETAPVSAKLDTMEEKNLEVRRFIVGTREYRRWKILRDRRREEEEKINAEAERGFSPPVYGTGRRGRHAETRYEEFPATGE